MGDPRGDAVPLPDDMDVELNQAGWVEFHPDEEQAKEEAQVEEAEHLKQRHHKLYRPVDSGEDERGPYDVIPLSMVRGGKATPTPVHRDPMKHLVLDQTIQPRGWYKNEIENDRTRPRPCLLPDSKVNTPWGYRAIKDLRIGDEVYGVEFGKYGPRVTRTIVMGTAVQTKFRYLKLELANGRILELTPEHLVYVPDKGWIEARELMRSDILLGPRGQAGGSATKITMEFPQVHDSETMCKVWGAITKANPEDMRQLPDPGPESTVLSLGRGQTFARDQIENAWDKSRQREGQPGQEIIGGDQREDETGHVEKAGQSCQRHSQECGVEAPTGRTSCCGQDGLLYINPEELQGPQGQDNSLPVYVGVLDSGVSGLEGDRLVIRREAFGDGRGILPARFYHQEPGQDCQVHRGQGLLPTRSARADEALESSSKGPGNSSGDMGQSQVGEVGYTTGEVGIISITEVEEETSVHDIQTGTANFFAEGVLVHNCYTEALLTSPYGGYCPVGCSFCYINNGSRGYRSTGIPTADPTYPEKYHEWLKKCMVAGAGYITSFSEAFHPLEDKYHITERLTNVFVEEGLPVFYCSRKLPAEWAIEALQKNPYSYMQWSINTSNPADFRKLSPGAASLEEMLSYIERMSKLGIYISIQCNPINAGITTLPELVKLVEILSQAGADHVIFKFVEQVANTRNTIIDRLKARRFPADRVELLDKMFNQVIGGVYTIQQDIRVAWLKELLVATRKHGMTMSTCYEYYENGKGGANLAPYFTTSDQCHGRGVPVHYRPALGEKFRPLPGCFRKGCLYCAEHGTKACQNERLQQATALEYSDLRNIKITGRESDWDLQGSCARPEYEHANLNQNPLLQTDAELWGWPPLETVLVKPQKGPRDVLDLGQVEEIM